MPYRVLGLQWKQAKMLWLMQASDTAHCGEPAELHVLPMLFRHAAGLQQKVFPDHKVLQGQAHRSVPAFKKRICLTHVQRYLQDGQSARQNEAHNLILS